MHWLPLTHQDPNITCSNDIGILTTHGQEQRYISPTTGICRKLIVQAVTPSGKFEVAIKNHTNDASKLAIWLLTHSPFKGWIIFEWIGKSVWFALKLLWPIVWFLVELYFNASDDSEDDTDSSYNTGYYKPYLRQFQGQLWAARSRMEHSSRIKEETEINTRTHACYPRILMIRSPNKKEWVRCVDRDIIIHAKYIAISYRASDVYSWGPREKKEKAQFTDDVRAAVLGQQFNAYWLDLECLGETPSEENLDVYCMSDVYRRAETTLIMLGRADSGEDKCWRSWGGRVWTFPEALLSSRLCYKFRDREEVESLSLFQLANLAYTDSEDEQAIVNAYANGKDPLERLERLTLLKKAIWRRAMAGFPTPSGPPPPPKSHMIGGGPVTGGGYKPHKAEQVYALMGFFEHRIQPNHDEDELRALARLSMANDSDRIADRMVSMFPSTTTPGACWYADSDIYDANLWDIVPEIQVAGVTENGALVLDGCRAAAIRWKDFPEIPFATTFSLRRKIVGSIPYFSWPFIVIGLGIIPHTSRTGGLVLIVIGLLLLFLSPRMFLYSKSGRIIDKQPWLIGVKGVVDRGTVESHLYGGTVAHFPRMYFTPSGSLFSKPEQFSRRIGSDEQYKDAKEQEKSGPGHMYTLIDTCSSTMYYFRAERPPTVCIFAGREGGLGRFVLCSESCKANELHKEMVLRMPTEISQRMELCGWVALG
ncbi:uncharacterized protein HD556DRAFT_776123 [Suillus plorans]|uniref:Heterokaryon incompatibility domain-containing protein n=1 Tax=Suillus plorans TaxID=116603 RepID=A0A9P7AJA6_9AGAM|nr:uncharacterized protein HD556DRAFT_776123 [Suillus plorans]KAG1789524.1 hypothetical protein HD556DRAFT_776123 [Suillus plorans]